MESSKVGGGTSRATPQVDDRKSTTAQIITFKIPALGKLGINLVNATGKNCVIVCHVYQDSIGSRCELKAGGELIGHPGDSSMKVWNNFLNHTKHRQLTFKVRRINEFTKWV